MGKGLAQLLYRYIELMCMCVYERKGKVGSDRRKS